MCMQMGGLGIRVLRVWVWRDQVLDSVQHADGRVGDQGAEGVGVEGSGAGQCPACRWEGWGSGS